MHTGYDNFWLCQKNRHETSSNLPENDYYLYSLLTGHYNHMLNGRYHTGVTSKYLNGVPNSYQNDQVRTVPPYKLPSLVHSQSNNSSNADNYYTKVFPTQTDNLRYFLKSFEAQQNCDLPNSGANIFQNNNSYNKVSNATRISQGSNCYDSNNGKLRVKNISSLNRDCQKITHYEDPLNYSINNCNRICDYESNLSASSCLPTSYVQAEQQGLNHMQKCIHYTSSSYQNNPHISSERQFLLNYSRQQNNLQSEDIQRHSGNSLLQDYLSKKNNIHSSTGNNKMNVQQNTTNLLSSPKTVTSNYSNESNNNVYNCISAQVSENFTDLNTNSFPLVQAQKQDNLQSKKVNQTSSVVQNSLQNSRKNQKREKLVYPKANIPHNGFENDFISITIPHTGQTTYIYPNEYRNKDKNSSASFQALLDSRVQVSHDGLNKNAQNCTKDNSIVPQTDHVSGMSSNKFLCENLIPSTQNYSFYSIRNDSNTGSRNVDTTCNSKTKPIENSVASTQRFQQEQAVLSNLNNRLEKNLIENTSNGGENNYEFNETGLDFSKKKTLNELSVKQENTGNDLDHGQVEENFTVKQEIKIEECSMDFSTNELEQKENSGFENETLPSNTDYNENTDINKVQESFAAFQKIETKSKIFAKQKNAQNVLEESNVNENSKNNDDYDEKAELENAKTSTEERNYESKINRDKLDLLIKFLNKDEENCPVIDGCHEMKKISTRSRRKLSKTRIVKNKNNSREMISMKTQKITQIGNFQELSKPAKNEKIIEEKSKSNCSGDETIHEKHTCVSENQVKSCNLSHDNEEEEKSDLSSKSKIKSISVCVQTEEISIEEENNLMNLMQTLHGHKTHYCINCSLSSSVDSFWVNLVTWELNCLNCFKKMNLKTNENVSNLKKTDCKGSEAKLVVEEENEENQKSECEELGEKSAHSKVNIKEVILQPTKDNIAVTCNRERSPVFDCNKNSIKHEVRTSEGTRKKITEEQMLKVRHSQEKSEKINPSKEFFSKTQSSDEKVSQVKSRKKSTSEEHSIKLSTHSVHQSEHSTCKKGESIEDIGSSKAKVQSGEDFRKVKKPHSHLVEKYIPKEQQESSKTKISKENVEQEKKGNSQNSIKQILPKEDILKTANNHPRDSSQIRKRSNSKEEFKSHKVRILEEQIMGASIIKSSKESSHSFKSHNVEETVKKSTFHLSPDKSNLPEETNKAKISKSVETKNNNTPEELAKKNKYFSYKDEEKEKSKQLLDQQRKRKKSIEELIPFKVSAVDEHLKNMKFTKRSCESSKTIISSHGDNSGFVNKTEHYQYENDDVPKRKNKYKSISSEEQSKNLKIPIDKIGKSRTSKENLKSPAIQVPENIKKGITLYESSDKEKKQFLGKIPKISQKRSEKDFARSPQFCLYDDKYPKSNMPGETLGSENKNSGTTFLKKKDESRLKQKDQFGF